MAETYLDQTQALNELRGRGEQSNDEMVRDFALYGREKRVEVLRAIDQDLDGGDLRKIAKEWRTRQRLGETHEALLKADR